MFKIDSTVFAVKVRHYLIFELLNYKNSLIIIINKLNMYLYSLTLNQPTLINNSVYGSFSGPNKHEIVVTKGSKILEMLRLDE